jgi:Flp pilus assembly protein TadD
MNRAERRRQEKLQKTTGKRSTSDISQAIESMIEPIVVLLNAQEFDRAEVALKELLAANAEHAEGLHLYGLLLSQTGRAADGIAALLKATALKPKEALYWNNLAAAYSRSQQLDLSADAARKAIELDQGYADPQKILVDVLLAQEKFDEGTDELAKLAKLRPTDARTWHHLGFNRAEQNRLGDAEEAYKKALELAPDNVVVMRELAAIYMNTWQYDAAQRLRRQADQIEAGNRA